MGTATKKAVKAMMVRSNLSAILIDEESTGADKAAARKAHKALNNTWSKRFSRNVTGFYNRKHETK